MQSTHPSLQLPLLKGNVAVLSLCYAASFVYQEVAVILSSIMHVLRCWYKVAATDIHANDLADRPGLLVLLTAGML